MSSTEHDILFADSTAVSVKAYTKQQLHFEILQQYGFWIDVNNVNKDFYKVAIKDETAAELDNGTIYKSASRDVSATLIFNALAQTTIGYLTDVSGDEDVGISGGVYSVSNLSDNDTVLGSSASPADQLRIGEHIVNGVMGAAFTGNYGPHPIEPSNRDKLISSVGAAYGAETNTLDDKIAAGLATTLLNASDGAHEEAIDGLLGQMRDENGNDHDVIATHFSDLSYNVAYPLFKQQNFWMKVMLTVELNSAEDANYIDVTDHDSNDEVNSENLVTPTYKGDQAGYQMKVNDLNANWVAAFKGTINHAGGSVTDGNTSGVETQVLSSLVVPLLLRFNVGA
jgi:hypothetical protein